MKEFIREPRQKVEEEVTYATAYKSTLLNKYFDSIEELKDAEADYRKKHEAELRAKEEKDNSLKAIKDAYAKYNEALKHKNKVLEEEVAKVEEARLTYEKLKSSFASKYGRYQLCYTNDGNNEEIKVDDYSDDIRQLLKEIDSNSILINPFNIFK